MQSPAIFFNCLKCELTYLQHYKTRSQAVADILEATDMLCNYDSEKLLGLKEIMESFTCTIIPRCFHFWVHPNF
jgi:hypothetical protein